jgi:hypothetical protein
MGLSQRNKLLYSIISVVSDIIFSKIIENTVNLYSKSE